MTTELTIRDEDDKKQEAIDRALAGSKKCEAEMFRLDCCKLDVAHEWGDLLVPLTTFMSNREITNLLNRAGFKISHGTVDDYLYVSIQWDRIVALVKDKPKRPGYKTAVKLARDQAKLLTYVPPDDG